MAALQTVETNVVRPLRHRHDAGMFPVLSGVGPGKDFVAIWMPVGLSSGFSPYDVSDQLTFVRAGYG